MKRVLSVLVVAFASISANADCVLNTTWGDEASEIAGTKSGWEFKNYQAVCEKLKKANASVQFVTGTAVLGNQSIAWANAMVKDASTGIMTNSYSRRITKTNTYASQDKAKEMLWEAMNEALESWSGLDSALASLNVERERIYGKPKESAKK